MHFRNNRKERPLIKTNIARFVLIGICLAVYLPASQAQIQSPWININTWDNSQVYRGWSAKEPLGEEVYGINGEQIGDVEDFFIGPDGQIAAVVIEGGDFLDIGDSHIAVPWGQVNRNGVTSISVPVSEDNLQAYGLYGGVDDRAAPGALWRLRNLIGDDLMLSDARYGDVRDVIFSQDGRIISVIGNPVYGAGFGRNPVAFPFRADVYNPHGPAYTTPYTRAQMQNITPFNYANLDARFERSAAFN